MIWSISSIFSTSACTPDCSTALRAVSYSLLQLLHPLPSTLISIALLLTRLRSACSRKRHRPGRKRDQAGPGSSPSPPPPQPASRTPSLHAGQETGHHQSGNGPRSPPGGPPPDRRWRGSEGDGKT